MNGRMKSSVSEKERCEKRGKDPGKEKHMRLLQSGFYSHTVRQNPADIVTVFHRHKNTVALSWCC